MRSWILNPEFRPKNGETHRLIGVKRYTLVRREWGSEGSDSRCCRGDEGRPLGAGVQKLASNQAVPL